MKFTRIQENEPRSDHITGLRKIIRFHPLFNFLQCDYWNINVLKHEGTLSQRRGREGSAFVLVHCNSIFLLRGMQNTSENYTLIKVPINSSLRALQTSKELRVNIKPHPSSRMPHLPDRWYFSSRNQQVKLLLAPLDCQYYPKGVSYIHNRCSLLKKIGFL